jgi:glyoxylase-like metal-dependent hydrolase (beta-lactamase superfamily II)
MNVKAFFDEPTWTVTYVVWDPDTKDAVIIDPVLGYDTVGSQTNHEQIETLDAFVRENGLRTHYVLETHAHADHLTAAQHLKRRLEAQVAIGEHITTVQKTFKKLFDLPDDFATDGSQFDRLLADGDVLEAGSLKIETIHTPGHTPACVTYKIDDAIFTGDALFMHDYGTGRCDFPAGSASNLYDSIQKLYALPDETRVFVGHDYSPGGREPRWETTISREKAENPQLNGATTKEQFVTMREARDKTLKAPKLIFQSVQVNVDAGQLPAPAANGKRYLKLPINLFGGPEEP